MAEVTGSGRAKASTFEKEKYELTQFQYPYDLHEENGGYGGNFAVFYINALVTAKIKSEASAKGSEESIFLDGVETNLRGKLIGIDATPGTLMVSNALLGAGAGAVATLINGKWLKDATTAGAIASLATAVVLNQVKQVDKSTGKVTYNLGRPTKRLTTAISLHVPNNLNIRYSTSWQEEGTLAFSAGLSGAVAGADTISEVIDHWNTSKKIKDSAGVGSLLGDVLTNLAVSKAPFIAAGLSAISGLAGNPRKEQIFNNVNYREFTVDYTFSPRNETESKHIKDIIYLFKFHMHPEYKDKNGFIYIYPSEFDIVYYKDGKENLNIHRHTSCVLKDMQVNYTPNGAFNTFLDGAPTQINVSLTFLELGILTKEEIKAGY